MLSFNQWIFKAYGRSFRSLVRELRGIYQDSGVIARWKKSLRQSYLVYRKG